MDTPSSSLQNTISCTSSVVATGFLCPPTPTTDRSGPKSPPSHPASPSHFPLLHRPASAFWPGSLHLNEAFQEHSGDVDLAPFHRPSLLSRLRRASRASSPSPSCTCSCTPRSSLLALTTTHDVDVSLSPPGSRRCNTTELLDEIEFLKPHRHIFRSEAAPTAAPVAAVRPQQALEYLGATASRMCRSRSAECMRMAPESLEANASPTPSHPTNFCINPSASDSQVVMGSIQVMSGHGWPSGSKTGSYSLRKVQPGGEERSHAALEAQARILAERVQCIHKAAKHSGEEHLAGGRLQPQKPAKRGGDRYSPSGSGRLQQRRAGEQDTGSTEVPPELHLQSLSRTGAQLSVRSGVTTSPTPRQHPSPEPQDMHDVKPPCHGSPLDEMGLLSLSRAKQCAESCFAVPPVEVCKPSTLRLFSDCSDSYGSSCSAPLCGKRGGFFGPPSAQSSFVERSGSRGRQNIDGPVKGSPDQGQAGMQRTKSCNAAGSRKVELRVGGTADVPAEPLSPLFEAFTFPMSRNFFFSDGSRIHVRLPGDPGGHE